MMFRPTHFVIIFAVVLYVNAIPVPPSPSVADGPRPGGPDKGDLDTDATTYWRLSYYGPRWGYDPSYEPQYSNRLAGWGYGFGKLYRAQPHYLYPIPTSVIEVN